MRMPFCVIGADIVKHISVDIHVILIDKNLQSLSSRWMDFETKVFFFDKTDTNRNTHKYHPNMNILKKPGVERL